MLFIEMMLLVIMFLCWFCIFWLLSLIEVVLIFCSDIVSLFIVNIRWWGSMLLFGNMIL